MGHTASHDLASGGLTATEHRLANGLRVVLSEDHLTPVAAVCLWYDVGSRNEVDGPDRPGAPVRAPDVPGLGAGHGATATSS